jgi:60 kDa SS-A/Ro ribonucleoprotein
MVEHPHYDPFYTNMPVLPFLEKEMYTKHYSDRNKVTPQTEKSESHQVQNSAGGYSYAVDGWGRLDRFLILGSEGGTFYIGERQLTIENAENLKKCIQEDGHRVVDQIVKVSQEGLAYRNDPALFALAVCTAAKDDDVRRHALQALPLVARTGTHLFHFAEYVENFRGWGRGLRQAVASWYEDKPVENVAWQAIKYKQRDGWTHRDLLRLAHRKDKHKVDAHRAALYDYICRGTVNEKFVPGIVLAVDHVNKNPENKDLVVGHILADRLPRECVPTDLLNDKDVWKALLKDMPLHATVRNLGKMTNLEILKPFAPEVSAVADRITDAENIKKSRMHPMGLLLAMKTYAAGHGFRGNLEWSPDQQIIDALDNAFYLAFKNVVPSNKRLLLALDVSGSMTWNIMDTNLSCREASAAMALITMATEKSCHVVAFSGDGPNTFTSKGPQQGYWKGQLTPLAISPKQRLDDVVKKTADMDFGGTDCALPMLYAMDRGIEADAFVVYTDSETWAGGIHPMEALRQYRNKTGIPAKLIVVGMTSNGFTIADPNDAGSLDVVGFDASVPSVISNFIAG